jgi:hypothetical protein
MLVTCETGLKFEFLVWEDERESIFLETEIPIELKTLKLDF